MGLFKGNKNLHDLRLITVILYSDIPTMVTVYVKHVDKTSGAVIESELVDSFSPSPSLRVR